MSEMCCTRLAEYTGCKNYAKNRHLRTIAQLMHASTIGKKLVKQQYLFYVSSQYGERRLTNSWNRFTSLGHPNKFQWVSGFGFVTAPTSLNGGQPPNFAW